MKQVNFRRLQLTFLPVALLLALPAAQAQGLATASGSAGGYGSGVQRAPWLNQAQNLQQRLSPMTGDMKKLGATSRLSTLGNGVGVEGGNPGLRPKLPGAHSAGGAMPWANQAQQLQSRLAGGASNGSSDSSILSLSGTSSTDSLSSVPPPSAGGGIINPYAAGVSVSSLGSAVPGANSPYTSTGNAAGLKPYRQPYGLISVGAP